ncbi:MAG: phosphoribosylformylglycinamidine synthase subunit PurS [Cytophagales bacterium]|nr:phosphoribosylformylglycinamidine synthase subunit PurS [Bernardetiaceae bacterium]MDW8209947.1 phosphoribosylformylglycinamidine synthase subunit PurS [Cytophagales bacterium]
MKFIAEIQVMPQKEILDPQGKAVLMGLKNLGIHNVTDVRVGKHIRMELEAADEETARQEVEMTCRKLLANLIVEDYTYHIYPSQT